MNNWRSEFSDFICNDLWKSHKMNNYIKKNCPKNLYKYKTIDDYTIDSIRNGTMWVSSPNSFNDPYDCALFCECDSIIEKIVSTTDEFMEFKDIDKLNNILEKIDKESLNLKIVSYLDNIKNELAIACLTENNDNILMWSHYADNHKGICLEYDFYSIDSLFEVYPVIYENENFDLSESIAMTNSYGILKKVLTKSEVWKYENEWRIIFRNKNCELGGLIKFPKIKSIYLGCKIDENHKKSIVEIANKKGIVLYQMKMQKNKFKLEYNEL